MSSGIPHSLSPATTQEYTTVTVLYHTTSLTLCQPSDLQVNSHPHQGTRGGDSPLGFLLGYNTLSKREGLYRGGGGVLFQKLSSFAMPVLCIQHHLYPNYTIPLDIEDQVSLPSYQNLTYSGIPISQTNFHFPWTYLSVILPPIFRTSRFLKPIFVSLEVREKQDSTVHRSP